MTRPERRRHHRSQARDGRGAQREPANKLRQIERLEPPLLVFSSVALPRPASGAAYLENLSVDFDILEFRLAVDDGFSSARATTLEPSFPVVTTDTVAITQTGIQGVIPPMRVFDGRADNARQLLLPEPSLESMLWSAALACLGLLTRRRSH